MVDLTKDEVKALGHAVGLEVAHAYEQHTPWHSRRPPR